MAPRQKVNDTPAPSTRRKVVLPPDDAPAPAPAVSVDGGDLAELIRIPSGAVLLDLVLGEGYPLGRIVNLVGDRSSGKTLLAIEAIANFVLHLGEAKHARYIDAESAFDATYAAVVGMPKGIQVKPDGMQTVEEFFDDLSAFLAAMPDDTPCMYVLDSLDALSDTGEMARDMDQGSYGAEKAKKLSQLFRRLVTPINQKNCLLVIVSQIRDRIGITFGETKTRSGGKALDFYASQIIWLSEKVKIKRTALGVERAIGVEIRARTKKNKAGAPFRECDLTILFNYGLDDEVSMLNWIKTCKAESALPAGVTLDGLRKELDAARRGKDRAAVRVIARTLQTAVQHQWQLIEKRLEPPMRKYDDAD